MSNENQPKKSLYERLHESLELVEHPTSWLLLGILLVLFASGSLDFSLNFDGQSIVIGEATNPLYRISINFLGVLLFLLGIYVIMERKFQSAKVLTILFAVMYMALASTMSYLSLQYIKTPGILMEWEYEPKGSLVKVTINPGGLKKYEEKSLVLIVRVVDEKTDYLDDTKIQIGYPFHIPSTNYPPFVMALHLNKIKQYFKPFIDLELFLLALPIELDLRDLDTIGQIINNGGKLVGGGGVSTIPDLENSSELLILYEMLDYAERQKMENTICASNVSVL